MKTPATLSSPPSIALPPRAWTTAAGVRHDVNKSQRHGEIFNAREHMVRGRFLLVLKLRNRKRHGGLLLIRGRRERASDLPAECGRTSAHSARRRWRRRDAGPADSGPLRQTRYPALE